MENLASSNALLANMPSDILNDFMSRAELVHFDLNEPAMMESEFSGFVEFPTAGLLSYTVKPDPETHIEIASIGRNGFLGAAEIFGMGSLPQAAFWMVAGNSYRLTRENFGILLRQHDDFAQICKRYTGQLFSEVCLNFGCASRHNLENRCAKWLLLTHDRIGMDHFYVTQEFLAKILGTKRGRINFVATQLQTAGLIQYSRGNIKILDRAGLIKASCQCYQKISGVAAGVAMADLNLN